MKTIKYKKTYQNSVFKIDVQTNSSKIFKLINNSLDFRVRKHMQKSKIKIGYIIEEQENTKDSDFVYDGHVSTGKLLSFNLADVKADYKNGKVKVKVYNYIDSCKERILDLIFFKPFHFIMENKKYYYIHSSMVSAGEDCMLIVGNQSSGKTTLALTLRFNGFDVQCDDDCFLSLDKDRAEITPFPTKLGLNYRLLKRYPKLKRKIIKNYIYGDKYRMSIKGLGLAKSQKINSFSCRMIVFPRYNANIRSLKIKKLNSDNIFSRLMKQGSMMSKTRFWALSFLSKEAQAYSLEYNDKHLRKIPLLLSELFDKAVKEK